MNLRVSREEKFDFRRGNNVEVSSYKFLENEGLDLTNHDHELYSINTNTFLSQTVNRKEGSCMFELERLNGKEQWSTFETN